MPSIGQNDTLAYSGFDTFRILSQSDFASCHKMGDTYFCKGRNDLRADITETCLGSLYLQQGKGIQKNCKFTSGQLRLKNSSLPIRFAVRIENML